MVLTAQLGFHPLASLGLVVPLMALLGYGLQRGIFNRTLGNDILPVSDDGQGVPPKGGRTCFLRSAPAGPRAGAATPAAARFVRALVSAGGAQPNRRGHYGTMRIALPKAFRSSLESPRPITFTHYDDRLYRIRLRDRAATEIAASLPQIIQRGWASEDAVDIDSLSSRSARGRDCGCAGPSVRRQATPPASRPR